MAVGTEAKQLIINKLKEVFAANFLGEDSGKVYVKSRENGEDKVVAISMTCPKTLPSFRAVIEEAPPWEEPRPMIAEISPEEQENIRKLIEELGL